MGVEVNTDEHKAVAQMNGRSQDRSAREEHSNPTSATTGSPKRAKQLMTSVIKRAVVALGSYR